MWSVSRKVRVTLLNITTSHTKEEKKEIFHTWHLLDIKTQQETELKYCKFTRIGSKLVKTERQVLVFVLTGFFEIFLLVTQFLLILNLF